MKPVIFTFFALIFSVKLYSIDTLGLLTPDRPGFGDAVFITPKNYWMIETGFWTENQSIKDLNSNTRGIGINSTLFRYGISKKTELRFDYSLWQEKTNKEKFITGFQPARLGLKTSIVKNKGIVPDVTFIGMIGFPFLTSDAFRTNKANPSMELSFANPLNDWMTLCYNLGAAWDGENNQPDYYYALSLEMSVFEKFGCYIQVHGDQQKFGVPGNLSNMKQSFVESGIVFYPKDNIQLDISSGTSVRTFNSYSFLTLGFCIRLPK